MFEKIIKLNSWVSKLKEKKRIKFLKLFNIYADFLSIKNSIQPKHPVTKTINNQTAAFMSLFLASL